MLVLIEADSACVREVWSAAGTTGAHVDVHTYTPVHSIEYIHIDLHDMHTYIHTYVHDDMHCAHSEYGLLEYVPW